MRLLATAAVITLSSIAVSPALAQAVPAAPAIIPDGTMLDVTATGKTTRVPDLATIRALGERLVLGGTLVVYVPAFKVLFTSMDRKVGHVRRYRRTDLRAKVETAGLTVLRSEYVDSLGFAATLAFRAFANPWLCRLRLDRGRSSLVIVQFLIKNRSRLRRHRIRIGVAGAARVTDRRKLPRAVRAPHAAVGRGPAVELLRIVPVDRFIAPPASSPAR